MNVIEPGGQTSRFEGRLIPQAKETDVAAALARLDVLSRMLDSAVRIPGTSIRVGGDAALNLIPGLGTVVAQAISGYLLLEARRLGAPKSLLLRMGMNIGVDFAISAVPVAGWVGDIFYRANVKNIALLREHLGSRSGVIDGKTSHR